jgi:hypothetical protein
MMTPDERSQSIQRRRSRQKKGYKVNVHTRRNFTLPGEEDLVKDMVAVLKLVNYTNVQIATIVGCSKGQVATYLNDPRVQKKILMLRERLPQAAIDLMQAYLIEAVQWIVDVGRTSSDEGMVLKAASEILDRGGIPKLSRNETVKPGGPLDKIDRSGHESVFTKFDKLDDDAKEEAALLYDAFESGLNQIVDKAKSKEIESDAATEE